MLTDSFDYELPSDLIAQEPVEPRDSCRLMVLDRDRGAVSHKHFYDLPALLKKDDVLVFNRSKVIPARLRFDFEGREVEILLTKHVGQSEWLSLVRPGKVFKENAEISLPGNVTAKVMEIREDGQRRIGFDLEDNEMREYVERYGKMPFPPYISGESASRDDYQTIFAQEEGSVAAPTAGLHFTESLLGKLKDSGVALEFVVLHVGLGTFLPVKTENVEDHFMHEESFELPSDVAERLTEFRKNGRRIIAVGTTAVRVLESSFDDEKQEFRAGDGETSIFIYPGYEWKSVNGLITNFHLPRSSLLMLVSALAGQQFVMKAYEEAIKKQYRFYSFGDAMLIL